MMTQPGKQHEWLRQLVGEWTSSGECVMGPDQPPMLSAGRETIRMVGDLWLVAESEVDAPGMGQMTAILTVGFDPAKNKFVGTWIGSPMANLFVYEGELDEKTNTLPLTTTGPNMTDPSKTATYQDVIEIKSPTERHFWSQMLGEDGKWHRFMTNKYLKVK